jgi:hypothetical protein
MDPAILKEIRDLFDRAERESDPQRKVADLEDALDLLETSSDEGSQLGPSDQTLVRNLRRSNTRRLLSQLVGMRNVQFDVWFGYLSLLIFRLGPEMDALLKEEEDLRSAYLAFVNLWGPEAVDVLQEALASAKGGL